MPARSRARALPPLLPAPRSVRPLAGGFALRDGMPIALSPVPPAAGGAGAGDPALGSARALRDAVRARCGVELAIESHARTRDLGPRIELSHGPHTGRAGDAHRLEVGAGRVAAAGGGPAGLRYAVETLAQLVARDGFVPACRVDDAPDLELRGVLLDVSRGKVPTAATLRALVDLCVRLKLNALLLYTEHTFRFRRHPEIGAGASPLDAETLRDLDGYACERHVELIPTLQSLGHMRHVLSLPRYARLAETERRWTLAPGVAESYRLLADLYDEYLPNFRSRWLNANCDEPFDLGRGRSAARAAQLGPGGLYLEHVRRVRELARERGRRAMIWADVVHAHPERIRELPRDLLLLDWWYEADGDFDRVKVFAENGIEFLACPGTSSWNSLFPRVDTSLANIAGHAAAARRHGARGLVVTDWGDHGHYNLQGGSWLGYAYAAQQAWSGDCPARAFDRAFSRALFGDASGEAARLYRALGALHATGIAPLRNASGLQLLFFDDLGPAPATRHARAPVLRRTLDRLARVRARIEAARAHLSGDPLTRAELELAADMSLLAARKGLLGLDFLAWRRRPARLDARGRRRLARGLDGLSREQRALGRTLHRLWLQRSAPSNFEITKRRLDVSVRSLRAAARALERGRPPAPPPPSEAFELRAFLELFVGYGEGGG